ncbi:hypothetical protein [Enterococcus sp. HY326]|uniref:hypothetical protein n=1 Tax=Enterococcus sp. HY326 TaxID=2971265 RepID=UPI00223FB224|nr:hypothetical protein [Enterococcus sp. HY326]
MEMEADTLDSNEKTGSQSYSQLKDLLKRGYATAEATLAAAEGLIPGAIGPADNRVLAILPLSYSSKQKHSLVVLDGRVKLILESPKNCLDTLLLFQLGVRDPQAFLASFKKFIGNCRYKLPCTTPNFTLFSIESVENGAWLNISMIKDIKYHDKGGTITLLDGSVLPIFTCRRSISKQLKLAYQCAVILKLNFSGLTPLIHLPASIAELLNVPVNDFNKKILHELELTKDWPGSWELSQCYQDNLIKACLRKEREQR